MEGLQMNIQDIIAAAGMIVLVIALMSLAVSVFTKDKHIRKERRSIFMQGMICSLILCYISWLVG